MSVDLATLAVRRKLSLDELNGRSVAIDAYNVLYQFLTIIRGPDGTPLSDANGNVTSHLSGLFYRTIELIDNGITPIYVFDGIPSKLKQKTIEARMGRRNEALEAWAQAKKEGNLEDARKYAQQSTRINKYIVESSRHLLELMGVQYVNAPGEGEAQASRMCRDGIVYAAASQDYDTLLFGSPLVVRNLTISGRRKLPSKNIFINIEPEIVSLEETLKNLGITQRKLIWIGILLGTDFNDGIKGVGPKTAIKIVNGASSLSDVEAYIKDKYKVEFSSDVNEVEDLFLNPEVSESDIGSAVRGFRGIMNKASLLDFMCKEHGFSEDRIGKFVDKLDAKNSSRGQHRLF
jgi:flap endonuclease-1